MEMPIPKPPNDPDLKNIIDKLAIFVARNGPEFERMTKQKQKDNPKFSFLFGGEFFNYYQFKVTTERGNVGGSASIPPNFGGPIPTEVAPPPSTTVPPPLIPTVTTELYLDQQKQSLIQQQAIIQQTITQQAIQTAPWQQNNQLTQQIQGLQQQISQHQQMMDQQIKQSEQNLAAQYQSLIARQQILIEEAIINAQEEKLKKLSTECELSLDELDKITAPIIESCTKDAILNGKSWIFQHCITDDYCSLISLYLLKRITNKEATFELRLHLIYLINDLLHHCQRKNADELKVNLEKCVIPIFCTAMVGAEEDKKIKLTKLLNLWEQNKYFDITTIEQLKDPATGLSNYQASLITQYASVVSQITNNTQQQYNGLQKQHQDFASHLGLQLQQLQQQLQQLLQQQQQQPTGPPVSSQASVVPPPVQVTVGPPDQVTAPTPVSVVPGLVQPGGEITVIPQQVVTAVSSALPPVVAVPTVDTVTTAPPATLPTSIHGPPVTGPPPPGLPSQFSTPPPGFAGAPPGFIRGPPPPTLDFGAVPPGGPPPGAPPGGPPGPNFPPPDFHGGPPPPNRFALPDLSKPPPGFPPGPPGGLPGPPIAPPDIDLTPSVPYYELPAGLMAPLVKLEDNEYRPLDPRDIRLPPPMPPSERLLMAVEAFYSQPTHERPRDSEGWEKLGLYEFFKAKQRAKKIKEQEQERTGMNSRSRSRSRSVERDNRKDQQRSRSSSRSPSPSPPRNKRRYNSRHSRSRSRSRSRSPSESPLPYLRSSKSPSPTPVRQQRRLSPSPRRNRQNSRSPTPPLGASFGSIRDDMMPNVNPDSEAKLGFDNKGHQLLKKMGWGGKGLGASEQGIVDPISGGDVRDRQDMFKGIGMDLKDPFEQFRKSKSAGFIQRMRARDEARDANKGSRSRKDKEEDG